MWISPLDSAWKVDHFSYKVFENRYRHRGDTPLFIIASISNDFFSLIHNHSLPFWWNQSLNPSINWASNQSIHQSIHPLYVQLVFIKSMALQKCHSSSPFFLFFLLCWRKVYVPPLIIIFTQSINPSINQSIRQSF